MLASIDPVDTGVESIDVEHRRIAALFTLLHDALEVPDFRTARDLHATLTERLDEHFRREEDVLVRYGYPDAKGVGFEHRAAMGILAEFGTALDRKRPGECRVILNEVLYRFLNCVYADLSCMQYLMKLGVDPANLMRA